MKAIQKYNKSYLEHCRTMTPDQIAQFLEDFRMLQGPTKEKGTSSKLISMKIPQDLLDAFRSKCLLSGIPYQTMIKKLMRDWLG